MSNIELIKEAVNEWGEGKITAEQAMTNIAIVLAINEAPSKECIEWGKQSWKEFINE